ncbi:MAG: TMEM175 family protein [Syntrophothermus sp.]
MNQKSSSLSEPGNYVNQERLIFLVDGVFAITLTLLVLELRPPEFGNSSLKDSLLAMMPRLYIYLIAFYSIANHWVVHQRMFRHITELDTSLLWFTIMSLLFITLIPAATAIVGRYPDQNLAVACFSANSLFHALSNFLFWAYVVRGQKRFAANSDPRLLAISSQVWLIISIGWLVSIPLGFINVYVAYAAWIVWPNLVSIWANRKRRALYPAKHPGR